MNSNTPSPIDTTYEAKARAQMELWQTEVLKGPSLMGRTARGAQLRLNEMIPEKVHAAVTTAMEKMTRVIITGSDLTTADPLESGTLQEREAAVEQKVAAYRAAAAAGGGIAGAGGFALAMAEFPALITTKLKLLFDIAALYGHDGAKLSERLYILHIFQLAFSSAEHRKDVFTAMLDWDHRTHPENLDSFEWRRFQQEYRDYIDLAKLMQLVPVIGAPVGAVVNYRLLKRLGHTAVNAYRLRWLAR
jgi:hypothetical protein